MFQCTNVAALWDSSVEAKCFSPQTLRGLGYTNTGKEMSVSLQWKFAINLTKALNITTDLLFAIIIPVSICQS